MKKLFNYLKLHLLLLTILSFFVLLAFLIYQNTYRDTEISTKRAIINELKVNIERSVSLGKVYSDKYAFTTALNQSLGTDLNSLGIKQIVFIDQNGKILYRHEGRRYHNYKELLQLIYPNQQLQSIVEERSLLWINLGLRKYKLNDADAEVTNDFGAFFVAFSKSEFTAPYQSFIDTFGIYILISYLIGSLLLIFALPNKKALNIHNAQAMNATVFLFSKPKVFFSIILSQTILSFFLVTNFLVLFEEKASEVVEQTLDIQSNKIERLLEMGLPITEYSRAADFYINELSNNKDIATLEIFDNDNSLILDVDMQRKQNKILQSYTVDLAVDNQMYGSMSISLGNSEIISKMISAVADILTVFVISLLAVTEYVIFISLPKSRKKHLHSYDEEKQLIPISYIRGAIAICNFATSLTISFLPISMLKLTQDFGFFGINPIVASSFPATFEFGTTLFSFLFVQRITNRFGWQNAFFIGTICYAIGSIASAFAFNPTALILSRMISGFAYGFIWLSSYYFVFGNVPTPRNRSLAFALVTAGIYSGYLSGVITGGILSTQLSPQSVFILAAVVSLCSMFTIIFFMRPYYEGNAQVDQNNNQQNCKVKKISYLNYLTHKNIIFGLLLILIPMSFVQIGLLNFGVPIVLSELNFSTASISRTIISYGLVQIYIAPKLTKYFRNFENKRLIILFGVSLVFISLSLSSLNPYLLFVSVFFLGIAAAIIGPTLSSFILNQDISEKFGILRAITTQRFADKLGQALGPVLYGSLLSVLAYSQTMIFISILFLVLGVLFYFITDSQTNDNS